MKNCNLFALAKQRIQVIEMDSLEIDCDELGVEKFGIISIDGCHSEKHTANDLAIGELLLSHDGVLVLDDITNQDWMGVVSAACAFFNTERKIVPFAVGFHKLFCCSRDNLEFVRSTILKDAELLRRNAIIVGKTTEFVGHQLFVLFDLNKKTG